MYIDVYVYFCDIMTTNVFVRWKSQVNKFNSIKNLILCHLTTPTGCGSGFGSKCQKKLNGCG